MRCKVTVEVSRILEANEQDVMVAGAHIDPVAICHPNRNLAVNAENSLVVCIDGDADR